MIPSPAYPPMLDKYMSHLIIGPSGRRQVVG